MSEFGRVLEGKVMRVGECGGGSEKVDEVGVSGGGDDGAGDRSCVSGLVDLVCSSIDYDLC